MYMYTVIDLHDCTCTCIVCIIWRCLSVYVHIHCTLYMTTCVTVYFVYVHQILFCTCNVYLPYTCSRSFCQPKCLRIISNLDMIKFFQINKFFCVLHCIKICKILGRPQKFLLLWHACVYYCVSTWLFIFLFNKSVNMHSWFMHILLYFCFRCKAIKYFDQSSRTDQVVWFRNCRRVSEFIG